MNPHQARIATDLAQQIGAWAWRFKPTTSQSERVAASMRDFSGCVIAGVGCGEMAAAFRLAPRGSIPVWGLEQQFCTAGAALVMGTAGAMFQLHDIFPPAGLHPSSPVIAAAFASYADTPVTVSAMTAAIAAGYEVCNRIGLACTPGQLIAGGTPTASAGALGAAVAAARIRGLDAAGIGRAISCAALLLQAVPLASLCAHGTLAPLHGGLAARAGVEAAQLADFGDAGNGALEGFGAVPGLIRLLGGATEQCVPAGWDGSTLDRVAWKLMPSCFATHPALEALARLLDAEHDQIIEMQVALPARMLPLVEHGPISDGLYDRLMSLRWVLARAALRGGQYDFHTVGEPVDQSAINALLPRIRVSHDRKLDAIDPAVAAVDMRIDFPHGRHRRLAYRRLIGEEPTDPGIVGWTSRHDHPGLDDKFAWLTRHSPSLRDDVLRRLAA